MARFARAVAVGRAYHVTQRCIDRQRVFFTDADRRSYLDLLVVYAAQAFVQQLEKELRRPLTPRQGLRNDLCNACAAAF
ncbi:MAG TPA: hypothetical protein VL990_14655 [Acidobacteriaceae bacterium]|nr:hypothetical protein [Acidobacteriaceae bacterium]